MAAATGPEEMLEFWRAAGKERWFAKDAAFDAHCVQRFEAPWRRAAAGELAHWETTAETALALVLLLDQMPRNMFRGTPRVYASDPLAKAVAARAIDKGFDLKVDPALRLFFYLPFAHAETMADQDRSVALAEALGDAEALKSARRHRAIVRRFGRFPHRNAILGRASTPDELDWLAREDSFKG